MADVQIEKGYTMIANEIFEAMAKVKLSPTQYRILFVVWRYTYGFKRCEHELSLSFISTATGCDKRQIQRELKSLEEKKIITQKIKSGSYRIIKFNKNYDVWGIGETDNGETDNGETVNTTIGETVNTTIGETVNQERKTKENFKETVKSAFDEFWTIYKKKNNKANSLKKFTVRFKKHGKDKIINGAKCYMNENKDTDTKFIKDASTFLNQETFLDYELVEEKKEDDERQKMIKYKKELENKLADGIEEYEVFGNLHVYKFHKKELGEVNERLRKLEAEGVNS